MLMVAYFYSKFTMQIRLAFAGALLAICLLGTHWIGFSHSISHATQQNQSELVASMAASTSVTHSSDVCHLFEALTLAGFITLSNAIDISTQVSLRLIEITQDSLIKTWSALPYQSRAPPTILL